ncbi:hypothetical protein B0T22DRAFT_472488 [Podospora appendiculata]|uniref:Uncharacterized protein n=1 Tax=Podospora appendiculata TaxID=314037 RepID=A0AAE0WZG9_9PEZI|nr:hypothetical protein B0T22DRAFT_472488 [Podospora appendiculata]
MPGSFYIDEDVWPGLWTIPSLSIRREHGLVHSLYPTPVGILDGNNNPVDWALPTLFPRGYDGLDEVGNTWLWLENICMAGDHAMFLRMAAREDGQRFLRSPFTCQWLIVTALWNGHRALAREIICLKTGVPGVCMRVFPFQGRNLHLNFFEMFMESLVEVPEGHGLSMSPAIWAALVRTGWVVARSGLVAMSRRNENHPEGADLSNALLEAGVDPRFDGVCRRSKL